MNCQHRNMVDPPPGKRLRVCLDCCKRIIECDCCDAKLEAGPHVAHSGWTKRGWRDGTDSMVTECSDCASDRTPQ